MKFKLLCWILIVLMCSHPSFAKATVSVDNIKTSAEKGNVRSQIQLALMYEKGTQVPLDTKEAIRWFTKAAEQGSVDAQYFLGSLYYFKGNESENNLVEGLKWLTKAGDQGDKDSLFFLGKIYLRGNGVTKDYVKAEKLLSKAAEHGHIDAVYYLAGMYYCGLGVKKDIDKSISYYELASAKGSKNAKKILGPIYINIGIENQKLRSAQGYTLAEKYYKKAFELKYSNAQKLLDNLYISAGIAISAGDLNPKALELTLLWYKTLAEDGNIDAQYYMGRLYHFGKNLKKNDWEAEKWYRKAAENGHASAQAVLGKMYQEGVGGLETNLKEAEYWYRLSAEQGDIRGQLALSALLISSQKFSEAQQWLRKPADSGNANAQSVLGLMFVYGIGGSQNLDSGTKLLLSASENGAHYGDPLLAFLYIEGNVLPKDVKKGLSILEKESKLNNGMADYFLGVIHQEGLGVKRDLLIAKNHFGSSVENGFDAARIKLIEVDTELERPVTRDTSHIQGSENYSRQFSSPADVFSSIGKAAIQLVIIAAKVAVVVAVVALGAYADPQFLTSSPRKYQSGTGDGYRSSFGNEYKYDLSNRLDRISYSVDPQAKLMDSIYKPITPSVVLEELVGQKGGGLKK